MYLANTDKHSVDLPFITKEKKQQEEVRFEKEEEEREEKRRGAFSLSICKHPVALAFLTDVCDCTPLERRMCLLPANIWCPDVGQCSRGTLPGWKVILPSN